MTYNEFMVKYDAFLFYFKHYLSCQIETKIAGYHSAKAFAEANGLSETMVSRMRNNPLIVSDKMIKKILGPDIFDTDIPEDETQIKIFVLEEELKRLKGEKQ